MVKTLRTSTIKAHVTPGERAELATHAHRLGLTVSNYIRNVMIGFRLPKNAVNAMAIRDLYKINADMARIGNLLKMAMDDDDFPVSKNGALAPEFLFLRMEETRQRLKTKIEEL